MTDTEHLREQLKYLIHLQEIDDQLSDIEEDRGELPTELEKLQNQINRFDQLLVQTIRTIEQLNERRLSLTRGIEEARIRKRQYEDQLYTVTSNREYEALTKEIEELQKLLGKNSEEIQRVGQELQKKEDEQSRLEKHIHQLKIDFLKLKKDLEDVVQDVSEEEIRLKKMREETVTKIAVPIYNHYERIRKARSGKGIAFLKENGACGGCFNIVPPQRQVEIKTLHDFILCESCGRVLITMDLKD
ncbi:MAG: C4-type zinc ribbon domain-containing protein [bacterium]|nr:C4-type zinc ribbon domain-containing protein [bacterium]